ncbi:hypothetical protein B488_12530 [Liberibacter crescens BT-1]|uniref:Uncharacterized protein n=2 Tax=Liberibacter crescens TaxID=1273132 RepID=L0EWL1_LIBCB|nr:hypothetical protein [Liberibacter crescens]AGA65245.1 hypothetical protein B488_12530 [Liberibacter crescens BT-1]AMC13186.1 hypothetical protein RL73_06330 [Liberibacter crescens]
MSSSLRVTAITFLVLGLSSHPTGDLFFKNTSIDCFFAVTKLFPEKGRQLLSAESYGETCIITMLIQDIGKRPRKLTIKVPINKVKR